MPKEPSVPDDLESLIGKRGGKDRRRKNADRPLENDDGPGAIRRQSSQRDRRQQKNYRDLLDGDDDD